MMTTINNKIIVGLSGGVDSSAAVLILRKQGYDVITASIRFSPRHDSEIVAAERLARELSTEHHILDAQDDFKRYVLADFGEKYLNGLTPNPCIACNPSVKFKTLTEFADGLGVEKIATGHYADIINIDGHALLTSAEEKGRDQSYMLYRLPQQTLKRVVFPLANYDKKHIRNVAKSNNLSSSDKPDSQELCFCDKYTDYLNDSGFMPKKGDFILPDGSKIPHKGSYYYTVGQRKGLSISYSHPLYVKRITGDGDVVLECRDGLIQDSVRISDTVFNPYFVELKSQLYCKIRSTASPVPCKIIETERGIYNIEFTQPVFAPSPGQSAVLYTEIDGRLVVVGGGIIVQNEV